MRLDNFNIPDSIKKELLEAGIYEKASPKEKKIEAYIAAIIFLQEWKDDGWLNFRADDVRITQRFHYITIEWSSRVQDEALSAKRFADIIRMFDEVSPNYDGKGNFSLGVSLYNPID